MDKQKILCGEKNDQTHAGLLPLKTLLDELLVTTSTLQVEKVFDFFFFLVIVFALFFFFISVINPSLFFSKVSWWSPTGCGGRSFPSAFFDFSTFFAGSTLAGSFLHNVKNIFLISAWHSDCASCSWRLWYASSDICVLANIIRYALSVLGEFTFYLD